MLKLLFLLFYSLSSLQAFGPWGQGADLARVENNLPAGQMESCNEWWVPLAEPSTTAPDATGVPALLGLDLLWLYQHTLSGKSQGHCPHYPSCSRYATIALHEYGLLPGCVMTAARLYRCNGSVHFCSHPQRIRIQNRLLIFNPPSDDAWWLKENHQP